MLQEIKLALGEKADILDFNSAKVSKDLINLPGPDFIERILTHSNRNNRVLGNFTDIMNHGRLGGTGYFSILPVDQGIEHSAGASFAPNPKFFDPETIVKLAIEAGCNAVASTFGVLGLLSRRYAHKIPFLVKINHNQLLSIPSESRQTLFGSVDEAYNLGAKAVGATIYFGSEDCNREIVEIAEAFERAHELGMVTVLWCYLRNDAFKVDGVDYHTAADLTSQAIHIGTTIQADIVKQKAPTCNGGYNAIKVGKTSPLVYSELSSDNPIDLNRLQVLESQAGRVPLINSGGESGKVDLQEAVFTAAVNKMAGASGIIMGRKAFQKPFNEGVSLIHAVQNVYLEKDIKVCD